MQQSELLTFIDTCWPDIYLYDRQKEMVLSVENDDETVCVAGNMLGKDFVAGLIALSYFMTRHPCRIVTTSAKDEHLDVLWGEIGKFLNSSKIALTMDKGGPLKYNHHNIERTVNGELCELSYIKGMVASQDAAAAMQGHHISRVGPNAGFDCCGLRITYPMPRTLFICDESSSVRDAYYPLISTWANRKFIFGNAWPCNNFFKHAIKGKPGTKDKGGNIPRPNGQGYYRYVMRVQATDSPNIRLALAQQRRGEVPTDELIVAGVKSWGDYQREKLTWDEAHCCVSHGADFYEGTGARLYPGLWLNRAEEIARNLKNKQKRRASAVGVDTAEGGDSTVMTAIDDFGILEQISKKTPDTSQITREVKAFMMKWGMSREDAHNCLFDAGGGGKEHADRMRDEGWKVRAIAFGGTASNIHLTRKLKTIVERVEEKEVAYVYKNRRAEMYGLARHLLDPVNEGFGIPEELAELRRQMEPIPLKYDGEGRLYVPPKDKPPGNPDSPVETLKELLGCSPDEADSFVLAVFGLMTKSNRAVAGAIL